MIYPKKQYLCTPNKKHSYYSLIKPEPEYYSYWNTRVHGLTLEDTLNADVFPKVWAEMIARELL